MSLNSATDWPSAGRVRPVLAFWPSAAVWLALMAYVVAVKLVITFLIPALFREHGLRSLENDAPALPTDYRLQPQARLRGGNMNEALVSTTEPVSATTWRNETSAIPQYSVGKILLIWAAAAIPMALLAWVVAPTLVQGAPSPLFVRLALLTAGLAWQFVLVVLLLARETRSFRWSELSRRLWLVTPRSPRTGQPSRRLWWWVLPLIIVAAGYEFAVIGALDRLWVTLAPFLAEPPNGSFSAALAAPEARAQLVGAWGFYMLFLVEALFNTVIGEELLFRGLLLPRMGGAFGRWDWVANGLLFGFYHLHAPWSILDNAVQGIFLLAFPSRYLRSAWFGIIVHSGQSVFFAFLLLGLVLGRA